MPLTTIGNVYCESACFSGPLKQFVGMIRSLNETLAEIERLIGQNAPEIAAANRALIARLTELDVAAGARRTGDLLPEFALPTLDGRIVSSTELLEKGPLVLVFYRGKWCDFCATSLAAIAAVQAEIAALGGHVVAISGETTGRGLALQIRLKHRIEFLVDADLGVSLQFGLLFRLPDSLIALLAPHGIVPAAIYGNSSGFLPVPATYIVSREGRIMRHYVDANWQRRMEPGEIIAALQTLAR